MMFAKNHLFLEVERISQCEHRAHKLTSHGEWGRPHSTATVLQTGNCWVVSPSGLFSTFRTGSLGNSFRCQTRSLSLTGGCIFCFYIYNTRGHFQDDFLSLEKCYTYTTSEESEIFSILAAHNLSLQLTFGGSEVFRMCALHIPSAHKQWDQFYRVNRTHSIWSLSLHTDICRGVPDISLAQLGLLLRLLNVGNQRQA